MTSKRRARQARGTPPTAARIARAEGRAGAGVADLPSRASSSNRLAAAGLVAVVLAGAWAYSNSLDGVLVLDDVRAIALNTTTRTLWPLSAPLSPPPASTVSGRPVANLSLAINYALAPADARDVFEPAREGQPSEVTERFRRNIRGYHLFNLAVHLLAALALAGVVRRTLASPALSPRFGRDAAPLAVATALIWVTHPLTTAAVTYVVQRVESLASLFYLVTLYCAIRAWDASARRTRWWMAAAIASCALGMATKEELVATAPIVVALWAWLFVVRPADHRGSSRQAVWPLLAGLASTWIVLAVLLMGEQRAPSLDLAWGSTWRYLLTQAEVVVHYVRLAIVPSPLVFFYTWPLQSSLAAVWWEATLLAAFAGLTFVGLVRRRPLAFAGAWFFLILAPSSSVLPVVTEVAAEHRMYLPLAAIVACAVVGVYLGVSEVRRKAPAMRGAAEQVWRKAPALRDTGLKPRATTVIAVATTMAVVIALGLTTRARNEDYGSDVGLWADTVAEDPANQRARVLYGTALAGAGRLQEAEAEFGAAVALDGSDPIARGRLGSILVMKGDLDGAIPNLEQAAALRPNDPDAHRWLGQAYAARHDEQRAVLHLDRAIQLLGDNPGLLGRLAAILADGDDPRVRNGARAVSLSERAVAATGRRDPMMLNVLSVAQASVGRFHDAAATAQEALPLARAQGNEGLAAELAQRVAAYEARAGAMR